MAGDIAASDIRGVTISGYTPQKPRVSTAPPIACCDRCRRPAGQTHASWCPNAESDRPSIGPSLAEWVRQRKEAAAPPPLAAEPEIKLDEDGEPIRPCAECGERLPPGKFKFCGAGCAAKDKARRMADQRAEAKASEPAVPCSECAQPVTDRRGATCGPECAKTRKDRLKTERTKPQMPITLPPTFGQIRMPAPSTDRPAAETAVCAHCGEQPIGAFSLKTDGTPPKYCDRHRSPKQRMAPAGSAGSVNEALIDTSAIDDQVPEVREEAPAPHPEMALSQADEPRESGQLLTPAPIDHDIEQLEHRLEDLRRVKELMAQDLVDLVHLQQLVAEAIVRKQAAQGVA